MNVPINVPGVGIRHLDISKLYKTENFCITGYWIETQSTIGFVFDQNRTWYPTLKVIEQAEETLKFNNKFDDHLRDNE